MSERASTKVFRAELLLAGIQGALKAIQKEADPGPVATCLAEAMKAAEEASLLLALVCKELMDSEIGVKGK